MSTGSVDEKLYPGNQNEYPEQRFLDSMFRVPSYYDSSTLGASTGTPVTRGPLITIRKMLGYSDSSPSPNIVPHGDCTENGDTLRIPPSQRSPVSLCPRERHEPPFSSDFHSDTLFKGGDNALIHLSPGLVGPNIMSNSVGEEKHRTTSLDFFRWPQRSRKPRTRREPGGLHRIVQSVRYKETDERVKPYVIVEVFEGHQIIKNWKCGDLVHYVNELGMAVIPSNFELPTPESSKKWIHELEQQKTSLKPKITRQPLPKLQTTKNTSVEHHHHYHFTPGRRTAPHQKGTPFNEGRTRPQVSQLTYRDIRQIFTDGAPVPSIEVRRNCIIVCFPPLSCIIMKDRVLLLIVEDMNSDHLISSLEEMQLRHMGKHHEAKKRADEKSRVHGQMICQTIEKPTKHFWKPLSSRTQEIVRSRSVQDINILGSPEPSYRTFPKEPKISLHSGMSQTGISDSPKEFGSSENDLETAYIGDHNEDDFPMEFETLELLVSAAFEQLDSDILHLERQFVLIARKISSPTTEGAEDLHILSGHVRCFADRVTLFDKVFDEILASPDDMIHMELSRQKESLSDPPEGVDITMWNEWMENEDFEEPNPDLEILLEFFDQEIEMFRQRLSRLTEKIESTERLINLKLSLARNTLLRWDVASSMVAAGIGCGTLLSGIFGMNLLSGLEESYSMFVGVSVSIGIFTAISVILIIVLIQTTRL